MPITQTAVSYYGLGYVEHAAADFQEMIEHGCNTVYLAVTEFDFDFWRPNIPKIVEKGHELGLKVVLDPWAPVIRSPTLPDARPMAAEVMSMMYYRIGRPQSITYSTRI